MTYTFNQSEEDYIRLNLYYFWYDNRRKTFRRGIYLLIPIVWVVLSTVINRGVIFRMTDYIAFAILVFGIPFMPRFYRWCMRYKIKLQLKKSDRKNLIGERDVTLLEDKIILKGSLTYSEIKWESLDKFVDHGNYLYLFIAVNHAIILPKRVFVNQEEERQTIEFIKAKMLSS